MPGGPNVGYATLQIIPSLRGAQGTIDKELRGVDSGKAGRTIGGGVLGGVKQSIVPGLKTLLAGSLIAGAATFGASVANEASSVAESVSKNTVVFGEASDAVLTFGENADSALGQSKAQALEATGVFGNLLRSVGLNEDKSADFSTSLTGLASDLASFNNTSVDDALGALRSGLVGETEPLKRFAVNLNEARLKQEALELGITDGTKALDANQKAQAAYRAIMEDTTLAQGDFARTSDGLANQQRILGAQFDNVKASLGSALLPALAAGVGFVNNTVIPGFGKLRELFEEEGLGGIFERVGDVIEEQAPIIGEKLLDLGGQLVAWVGPQIPPLLAELAGLLGEGAEWLLSDGLPLLAEGALQLVPALWQWISDPEDGAIVRLLEELPKFLEAFDTWLTEEMVPAALEGGGEIGGAIVTGIGEALRDDLKLPAGAEIEVPFLGWELDLPGTKQRALGGPVRRGMPYIVGEHQAELFVPDSNGTIIPQVPDVATWNGGAPDGATHLHLYGFERESAESGAMRALSWHRTIQATVRSR